VPVTGRTSVRAATAATIVRFMTSPDVGTPPVGGAPHDRPSRTDGMTTPFPTPHPYLRTRAARRPHLAGGPWRHEGHRHLHRRLPDPCGPRCRGAPPTGSPSAGSSPTRRSSP